MSNEDDWGDELDSLRAASQYHVLLFENEFVRVLDTRIPAGHTVPLHTHRWPSTLYILSWSDFVRRDAEGLILVDSRSAGKVAAGTVAWSGVLGPHTVENVGGLEMRVISVEMKSLSATGTR